MSKTGVNLQPGPWLAVSAAVRAQFIRAAVEVVTGLSRSVGDDREWRAYQRGFDAVFGNGQDGDWPHSEDGREIVATVVERRRLFYGATSAAELTEDSEWDCARAALVVASGVIA